MCFRWSVACVFIVSCGASPSSDAREKPVVFATESTSIDTLQVHLVSRLRVLLDAGVASDSAQLARVITPDFKAGDTRAQRRFARSFIGKSEDLTYWDVIAGRLSPRLEREYSTFRAVPNGRAGNVYALGDTSGVLTTWQYGSDGWRATYLIISSAEHVRAMLKESEARKLAR